MYVCMYVCMYVDSKLAIGEAKTFDDEEVAESREERQKLLQQACWASFKALSCVT